MFLIINVLIGLSSPAFSFSSSFADKFESESELWNLDSGLSKICFLFFDGLIFLAGIIFGSADIGRAPLCMAIFICLKKSFGTFLIPNALWASGWF